MKTREQIKWPNKRKSIDIGKILIVQDGRNRLWLYNKNGEIMNLTTRSLEALEMTLDKFFNEQF